MASLECRWRASCWVSSCRSTSSLYVMDGVHWWLDGKFNCLPDGPSCSTGSIRLFHASSCWWVRSSCVRFRICRCLRSAVGGLGCLVPIFCSCVLVLDSLYCWSRDCDVSLWCAVKMLFLTSNGGTHGAAGSFCSGSRVEFPARVDVLSSAIW